MEKKEPAGIKGIDSGKVNDIDADHKRAGSDRTLSKTAITTTQVNDYGEISWEPAGYASKSWVTRVIIRSVAHSEDRRPAPSGGETCKTNRVMIESHCPARHRTPAPWLMNPRDQKPDRE